MNRWKWHKAIMCAVGMIVLLHFLVPHHHHINTVDNCTHKSELVCESTSSAADVKYMGGWQFVPTGQALEGETFVAPAVDVHQLFGITSETLTLLFTSISPKIFGLRAPPVR